MLPTKTSFTPANAIKELTICMSSALVAKYVLAGRATPGGLFLTGGIAGVACAAHDYLFHGQDFQSLKKNMGTWDRRPYLFRVNPIS